MDTNAQRYAGYLRNSLADSSFTRGGLDAKAIQSYILCDHNFMRSGYIEQTLLQKLFENVSPNIDTIDVMLRPIVYRLNIEHGAANSQDAPEFMVPLATCALLARDGRCYPKTNDTLISRDLLEPLANGAFSIGLVEDLDAYLTKHCVKGIDYTNDDDASNPLSDDEFISAWQDYLNNVESLFTHVAKNWLDSFHNFERLDNVYLIPKHSIIGTTMHILPLYDKLRTTSSSVPLFETIAANVANSKKPCLSSHSTFSSRLAHSSDKFPLAQAQRDALTHLINTEKGEILAVNGPPGTGKTTLLLSVVASLWTKHALNQQEPPVIIAASTNNQAVTNIIDAFGKDFSAGNGCFSGRWLPRIQSFGAYFSSKSRAQNAEKSYQTESFFAFTEDPIYFQEAKSHYLNCALNALPNLKSNTIKEIVDELHSRLNKEVAKLEQIKRSWDCLESSRKMVQQQLGDDPAELKLKYQQGLLALLEIEKAWQTVRECWQKYLASESLVYALFSWLPPIANKRLLLAKMHLKTRWPQDDKQPDWQNFQAISVFIENKLSAVQQSIQQNRQKLEDIDARLKMLETHLDEWSLALAPLGIEGNAKRINLDQADSLADTQIRFHIFLLTTHYWEGRWLLDMQNLLPELTEFNSKRGRKSKEYRWYLRMKLTPCIVSTFYILPNHFHYVGAGLITDYLYNFADLLIVDEAGQVLPEVAGAAFSLSKKALVIGDTLQIEPIWNIPAKVDIGNLLEAKIIDDSNIELQYETLTQLGKTASSGSVMKIAQHASKYHYDTDMPAGMFLYDHRRCYDEIISFCNELVYKGKLHPKRGLSPKDAPYPALGYLHINGRCQQTKSGSRCNKMEATIIAKWLNENKVKLEQHFQEPLHDIVGIITPFSAQVSEIKRALRESNLSMSVDEEFDKLTVGTVHALQGAERKLILFSPVYSKHINGQFLDNQPSLLNVAVSRAKESFLVFGDMDIFDSNSQRPSGLLAKFLFSSETNQLDFDPIARDDLLKTDEVSVEILRDCLNHDRFLRDAINSAKTEILIVSPWLKTAAIESISILPLLQTASKKGIKVSIYTDIELNTKHDDEQKQQSLINHFYQLVSNLSCQGIEIILVNKIHSKIVIKDDDTLCIGSFNWLSAQREGNFVRHETSLIYQGKSNTVTDEIKLIKESLTELTAKNTNIAGCRSNCHALEP